MARHWAPLRDPEQRQTRSRSITNRGSVGAQWGQRPMFSEPGPDQPPPEQGSMGSEARPDDIHPSDERVGSEVRTDLTKANAIQLVPFHVITHNVSWPPTDAEIRAALGSTNHVGDAFMIRDGAGAGRMTLIVKGGGDTYWWGQLTKAT